MSTQARRDQIIKNLFNPFGFKPATLKNLTEDNRQTVINFLLNHPRQQQVRATRQEIMELIASAQK